MMTKGEYADGRQFLQLTPAKNGNSARFYTYPSFNHPGETALWIQIIDPEEKELYLTGFLIKDIEEAIHVLR